MTCPHCGAVTSVRAKRCSRCNAATHGPPQVAAATLTPLPTAILGGDTRIDPIAPPTPQATAPLEPGTPFGTRYRILRQLGAGGMGVVYQAWDAELGVAVALKVIRPEVATDPYSARDIERRFKRELLLARQVTHKNVVRIHDLGEVDGIKYITMPFIDGQDLATLLRDDGTLPIARTLRLMKQIAAGLQAAHDAGVVHRDLKPENIMVDGDDQASIMDFGISRSVAGTAATMTAHGAIVGTLEYMAPEQARGLQVDHRTDIYAFGLMMRDVLIGRSRLTSSDAFSEMMSRMAQPLPSMRVAHPSIPQAVDDIVSRSVDPDPDKRFATTAELVAALDALDAEGRALVAKPPAAGRSWPTLAAVAAIVAAVAVGATLYWRGTPAAASDTARAPMSVLIADFQNQTGDSVFEGSLEQALGIAMEGAAFISAYPRTDALQTLTRKMGGKKLDEAGALLLATSDGSLNVILAGAIAPARRGYTLTVRAIAPTRDGTIARTIATETAQVDSKLEVLDAVAKIAGRIRNELGEVEQPMSGGETFTAASLEAVREYALAQDLSQRGRDEEAIEHYRQAIGHDPEFGRAYAGWAVSAHSIGRTAEADGQWKQALARLDRMTEREKYRTYGAYYLIVTRNYPKAIENYQALIQRYPADAIGHANLALAYFYVLDFDNAKKEGKRALDLYPSSLRFQTNSALYTLYAGDFKAATAQAQKLIAAQPDVAYSYFIKAAGELASDRVDDARATYQSMASTKGGASTASIGLADLTMYSGGFERAIELLTAGIAADRAAGATASAVTKELALGEAHLAAGRASAAVAAVRRAMALRQGDDVLVPAARVFVAANAPAEAKAIATELESQLPVQSRAYAKVILGELALAHGRPKDAVQLFTEAKDVRDLWLARYLLGVAYVQAGLYAEGLSELEQCQRRIGEGIAIFLDEMPTFRYLPPLWYWMGRAQEGLENRPAAATRYRQFLDHRTDANDPVTRDARARVTQLQ